MRNFFLEILKWKALFNCEKQFNLRKLSTDLLKTFKFYFFLKINFNINKLI